MKDKIKDMVESSSTPWKTESDFWNWFRGNIRKAVWSRHPVRINFKNSKRFKAPIGKKTKGNPEGLVWANVCSKCTGTFRQTEVEVDHKEQATKEALKTDPTSFIMGMSVVVYEDLQLLCKPCHRIKSYADRHGLPFEEARVEKLVIEKTKQKALQQKKELLRCGLTESEISNPTLRREAYRKLIKSGAIK